jgi:hypothetical protein
MKVIFTRNKIKGSTSLTTCSLFKNYKTIYLMFFQYLNLLFEDASDALFTGISVHPHL